MSALLCIVRNINIDPARPGGQPVQEAVLAGVPGGAQPAGDDGQQGEDDPQHYAQHCHAIP